MDTAAFGPASGHSSRASGAWVNSFGRRAAAVGTILSLWVLPAAAFDPADTIGLYGAATTSAAEASLLPTKSLTRAYIPDQIDLSHRMPPPVMQHHNSCVAFSIGYAVRGYYAGLSHGGRFTNATPIPSPAHLHARTRPANTPCETSGVTMPSAIMALRRGAVDRRFVPDDATCGEAEVYDGPLDTRFEIDGGYLLYNRGRHGAVTRRHLDLIKQQLAKGHPVIVGLRLYAKIGERDPSQASSLLAYLEAGEIYDGSAGPHGVQVGAHAMAAVGYDERRQAFLVQNSWGPEWAGTGHGWLSYASFEADLDDAYLMDAGIEPPVPAPGLTNRQRRAEPIAGVGDLRSCSAVTRLGLAPGGKVRLAGFVSTRAERSILERVHGHDVSAVSVRPYPVCEAMKTLAEPLASPIRPQVDMAAGTTRLSYGDSLAFTVTTPPVPSFLYVAYIDAKGNALNLLPRTGTMREQHPPGSRVHFGDGREGRPVFLASPPAGNEAIVVIAARSPLRELEALDRGDHTFTMPALDGPGAGGGLVLTRPGAAEMPADDRFLLTAIRRALADQPLDGALPREVGAAVIHINVAEDHASR